MGSRNVRLSDAGTMEVDGNVDAVSGGANAIELYCGAKVATFERYISYRNESGSIENIVSGPVRKVGISVIVGSGDSAGSVVRH